MPRPRAASICTEPGCPNDQPCPDHKRTPWAGRERRASHGRGWTRTRQAILHRDRHTCQACGGTRCGNQHLEVDMIVPECEGGTTARTNLQTLGATCHQDKSLAEATRARTNAHR